MDQSHITAHVRIDARIFRRFALYDSFILNNHWRAPVLFAAIFTGFSMICFIHPDRAEAAKLGIVLFVLAFFLPLTYIAHFLLQIHDRNKQLGLKKPRPAYTLNMSKANLRIINDMKPEPEVSLSWESLHGVWRHKDAFYIYAHPSRAFIVPDGQYAPSPAQMFDFLSERLPEGRLHGKRP